MNTTTLAPGINVATGTSAFAVNVEAYVNGFRATNGPWVGGKKNFATSELLTAELTSIMGEFTIISLVDHLAAKPAKRNSAAKNLRQSNAQAGYAVPYTETSQQVVADEAKRKQMRNFYN
jgi:hypothetical protein